MSRTLLGRAAGATLVLALFLTPRIAAGQGAPLAGLPGVEQHQFRAQSGVEYNLLVSLPAGYDPEGPDTYPVVYVTDGHFGGVFGPLWSSYQYFAFRDMVEPLILVAIVQPFATSAEWGSERAFDLTPTQSPEQDARYQGLYDRPSPTGGGPAFLNMLKTELLPWVEARFRAGERKGLVGHSLGGLFATYVLLSDPTTFSDYLIASPSLWWDRLNFEQPQPRLMFEFEKRYAATHSNLPARVFMSFGTEEGPAEALRELGSLADSLAQRGYPDLSIEYQVFEGENHNSVVPAASSRGLLYLFGPN